MSISLVEKEIARFLKSPEPEVICIHGKWGVGKTYCWNAFLRTAKDQNAIALQSYAYVSLFGIDFLERLKYAIFENKVATDDIGIEPSVETFKSNTISVIKQLGLKSLAIIPSLPQAKNFASAFQSLSFLSVRKTVVCIDDLERKGDRLTMKDVMGLISHLRDQKKCKVALILNDDQLEKADEDDFKRYNEKVIDASLLFEPNPSDCVRIAVKGDGQALDWLRNAVIALGISNIRIIKKIERLVLRAVPLLTDFHPKVLHQAVQSLTLLAWSVYSEGAAAPLEFILHKRGKLFYGLRDDNEMSEDEKRWNSLLDEFGFVIADEFDLQLLEGIKHGFFDEAALADRADELHKTIEAFEAEGSLKAAWRLYHDSFDDNEAELVKAICDAYRQNVRFITPMNLNGAVSLLKDLQRPEEAESILHFYMEHRGENRELFDLSNYPFANDITDKDVCAAFDEKYQSFKDDQSPVEVLLRIAKNESWSRNDIALLSSLSADDFYTMFKSHKQGDLSRVIEASLQFERIVDASDDKKQISARAKEALVRIGRESLINRRRVQKKYAVEVGD